MKLNFHKTAFIVFFLLVSIVGTLRITGIPIRPDMIFIIICLFPLIAIHKSFNTRDLLQAALFVPFLVYFFFHLTFIKGGNIFNIKDILFFVLLAYPLLIFFFLNFLYKKLSLNFIKKWINIFIIFSFVVALIQYTNFLNLNNILQFYHLHLANDNASSISQFQNLQGRPFGTIGNPTWYGFIVYLMARLSVSLKSSRVYLVLAFIAILLSGARMSLITFIVFEIFIISFEGGFNFKTFKNFALKGLAFLALFVIAYFNLEFVRFIIDELLAGKTMQSDSIVYRAYMYDWLFNSGSFALFFGGLPYEKFPGFVDSEWVMRVLQFGFVGFFLMYLPYIYFSLLKYRNINYYFLIINCLFVSLTTFTISNYVIIPFIILYMVTLNKYMESRKHEFSQ